MSSIFFFRQKTAYDMRISDWSSDVCSSDLGGSATQGERGERTDAGADPPAVGGARPAGAQKLSRRAAPCRIYPHRPRTGGRWPCRGIGRLDRGSPRRPHFVRIRERPILYRWTIATLTST